MRRKIGILWGLLGLLAVVVGFGVSAPVTAAASYKIRPFRMHVTVLKNGDSNVTETMTYHFSDNYHGVFNVQDLRGIQGGRLTSVQSQLEDGPLVTAKSSNSEQTNTYQLTQTKRRLKVKLYRTVRRNNQLKVTYKFHLRGVITNYRDTAQLNWRLVGGGWDVPLGGVKLTVQLPATQVKQLQAWTHGPLDGHTQVDRAAGKVTMTVASNPANSFIESHLLFPTSVTATNTNRVNRNHKVAAQKQEAQQAADANQHRRSQKRLVYGGYVGLIVALVATLAGSWWWLRRHPANVYPHPIPVDHFFDVPRVSPALAESLVDFHFPNTDALTGDIMLAAGRHQLKIETVQDGRHETVRLTKTGDVDNYFLQKCFVRLGANDSFTLRELKAFAKKDKKGKVGKWFYHWQEGINEQADHYQDMANVVLRQRLVWLATAVSVLTAVLIVFAWVMGLAEFEITAGIGVVLLVAVWGYTFNRRGRIDRNNAEGLVLVNEIGGFRRMLKDIGHFNTAQIGDLILWEEILPYAAAFGMAKQVARKLEIDFGRAEVQASFIDFYPLYFGNFSGSSLGDAIGSGIASSIQTSSEMSSTSGGSGGFSGGSSGGFGGGSGGGAF